MTKQEIKDIEDFIDNEIFNYDIQYDYDIDDEIMEVTFKGHFTSNKEVTMSFKCEAGNVMYYGLCEAYLDAETRSFWIELMGRLIP